jgi:hypothetical protein
VSRNCFSVTSSRSIPQRTTTSTSPLDPSLLPRPLPTLMTLRPLMMFVIGVPAATDTLRPIGSLPSREYVVMYQYTTQYACTKNKIPSPHGRVRKWVDPLTSCSKVASRLNDKSPSLLSRQSSEISG